MAEPVVNSPDRWESFVTKLPEQYRTDPDQFLRAYDDRQRELDMARTEAADAARYMEWYRKEYTPWATQNQPLLQEFDAWKRTRGTASLPRRNSSMAGARGGLISLRVAAVASATTRCSFRRDGSNPSPSWGKM